MRPLSSQLGEFLVTGALIKIAARRLRQILERGHGRNQVCGRVGSSKAKKGWRDGRIIT